MKNKASLFVLLFVSVLLSSACSLEKNEAEETQEAKDTPVQTGEVSSGSVRLITEKSALATNRCNAGKVLFQYPDTWGGCTETKNGVSFRTDDEPYQVDLILTLNEVTGKDYVDNKAYSFNGNKLANGDGEFFEEAQGGSLMGGFIRLGNDYYEFNFDITSNEPAPEELDGVWRPNSSISKDDLISILRSAESADAKVNE